MKRIYIILLSIVQISSANKIKEKLSLNLSSLDSFSARYETISGDQKKDIKLVYSKNKYCLVSTQAETGKWVSTVFVSTKYPNGLAKSSLLFLTGKKGTEVSISDASSIPLHPLYCYHKACQLAGIITSNQTLHPQFDISLSESNLHIAVSSKLSSQVLQANWLKGFSDLDIVEENEQTVVYRQGRHSVEFDIETGMLVREEFPDDAAGKNRSITLKEFKKGSVPDDYVLVISGTEPLEISKKSSKGFRRLTLKMLGAYYHGALKRVPADFVEVHGEAFAAEAKRVGYDFAMEAFGRSMTNPACATPVSGVLKLINNLDCGQDLESLEKRLYENSFSQALTRNLRKLDALLWKNIEESPEIAKDIFNLWEVGFEKGFVKATVESIRKGFEPKNESLSEPIEKEKPLKSEI